ncbi:MAG TPA: DNA-processing protein DprA [Chthoniobacteraceae bacterium]|jgi:DNA processing protein|nr:DNA-processing protein DprA [Chthoniobacteraceae bacterium]
MTTTEAYIALNMLPGIGSARLRRLLEVFETPERILTAKGADLRTVQGIGREVSDAITSWESHVDLEAELRRIADFGAKVIAQDSPLYSPLLREITSPPIVLYVWGDLQPRDLHAIGVVGSRSASHYGIECAKKLSYQLAYAGLTVVSGLARGIDTAAHQGALAAQGRTIAVLGSGFHTIYPAENKGLAEKIAASGAVLSEFSMEVTADTQTFPMRNRIVAGWGTGVLVVEAGNGSGALITAGQAVDQGRNVYAVPGQIDRPGAAGSNRLIQQGAKLVTCAADILDDLNTLFPNLPREQAPAAARAAALKPDEKLVYEAINDDETPIDVIISKTNLPSGRVSSTLLLLEMKHMVKQLPGQHFVKLA